MNVKELFTVNSWGGKFLGAFIGYLIAGPIGILFGLFIATFLTHRLIEYYTNPQWAYFREKNETAQKIFIEITFSVMGYLAKADGRVSEQELNMARSLMHELHLNQNQKMQAMSLFNEGKKTQFNLSYKVSQLQRTCKNNPNLLRLFIEIQYQMAKIDGLTTRKIQVLDMIFLQLGFISFHKQYRFYEDFGSTSNADQQQKQQYSSDSYSSYSTWNYEPKKTNLDYAYALIEVSPNANQQEVKRAYRRLLSRNHPDKLISQGYSQEQIKKANEKTQKIVKAYELICEHKGW